MNDILVPPSFTRPILPQFQLKALKRARESGDAKEWKWMSSLQKCVVSATAAAMNEDVGESVGGGGGCYLLRASSLELNSLDGATMKAKASSNWVDCKCNLDRIPGGMDFLLILSQVVGSVGSVSISIYHL